MKTRLLSFALAAGLAVNSLLPALAEEKPAAKSPYPEMRTASGFSRAIQTVTGFTLVSGWVANHFIHKELSKHVSGDLHSKLSLYSGTDLLGGKARHISITGENVVLDKLVPLSRFRFESQQDMPLYVYKGSHPFLMRPVQFKVSAVMSEDDINRMLQSEQGRKRLTDMRAEIPPFGAQSFDALKPSVFIEQDKLTVQSLMNMHGAPEENALPIKLSGKLSPDRSRLELSDVDLQIEGMGDTKDIARVIENYFGDLVNLNHVKVDRHKVKVTFQKSELKDKRLNLEALITVEPDQKALKKALAAK